MDLQTAKLVEFAIFTESDTGIMGIDPKVLAFTWMVLDGCATVEDVLEQLPIDLHWKWDNYWSIWGSTEAEPAKRSEDDKVEITEKGIAALDESTEASVEAARQKAAEMIADVTGEQRPAEAKTEAAQQPGDKPPAEKRRTKKGR